MSKPPLKRIYLDTNILRGWPHVQNDLGFALRLAEWMQIDVRMPSVVEDELESQFVRSVREKLKDLENDIKQLGKLCRDVIEVPIEPLHASEEQMRGSFRKRSAYVKSALGVRDISLPDIPIAILVEMAINRQPPFEEHLVAKDSVVAGLQDTAILLSIVEHMRSEPLEGRCVLVSADRIFQREAVKKLIAFHGVTIEVFKSVEDLSKDLWSHVYGALRSLRDKESEPIKEALEREKERLAKEIVPLLTVNDLGRGTWKRVTEILNLQINNFENIETEMPNLSDVPPNATEYSRPENSQVKISVKVRVDIEAMTEEVRLWSALLSSGTGYAPNPASPALEQTMLHEKLNLSISGTVHGGLIGCFVLTSAEVEKS